MEKIHIILNEFIDSRIDRWIKKNICNVPQGFIEKNLRSKNITVNHYKVKSSYKLKFNDKILLKNFNPLPEKLKKKKKYIPSKKEIINSNVFIIEDNNNFCVINKPNGLPVQGGTKVRKNLVDLISRNSIFSNAKPYIVHRIDKETSGIILIAKNRKYAQLLTSLFRIRKIHKSYLSICYDEMDTIKGSLDDNLIRFDKNKRITERAITNYKILDKNSRSTLLLLNPITGRKHQIRKQLSLIGFPIIGDSKYIHTSNKINTHKFLMLHAYSVKFLINEQKYEFTVDVPDHFKKMLKTKKLILPKNL